MLFSFFDYYSIMITELNYTHFPKTNRLNQVKACNFFLFQRTTDLGRRVNKLVNQIEQAKN